MDLPRVGEAFPLRATERKIAILGTATSSVFQAPFGDPEWEIWALAHEIPNLKRVTKAFELHARPVWEKTRRDYVAVMSGFKGDLFMQEAHPEIPNAQVFPKDEVLSKFPKGYFTSSASWMMAYALLQKPSHVGLWGVDMATDGEYADQRPCMEFLLGLAAGKGIKIAVPESSALLKADHLYGYETRPARGEGAITRALLERDKKRYEDRLRTLEQEFAATTAALGIVDAYLDFTGHYERTGVRPA